MYYRKFRRELIDYLYKSFEEFRKKRINARNEIYNILYNTFRSEYIGEQLKRNYTRASLDDWYNDLMRQLKEWVDEFNEDFEEYDHKFMRVMKQIENMKFTQFEEGTLFTYDFYSGKVFESKSSNPNQYQVLLRGYWCDVGGQWASEKLDNGKYKFHFTPENAPRPYFTDLYED